MADRRERLHNYDDVDIEEGELRYCIISIGSSVTVTQDTDGTKFWPVSRVT